MSLINRARDFLIKQELTLAEDSPQGELCLVFPCKPFELLLFVKSLNEDTFLQLATPLPFKIQESTLDSTARFLHLINKESDMPGFGMDERACLVFYRLMLPCPQKMLSEELLIAYLLTTQQACKTYLTSIQAIANGKITLDVLLSTK